MSLGSVVGTFLFHPAPSPSAQLLAEIMFFLCYVPFHLTVLFISFPRGLPGPESDWDMLQKSFSLAAIKTWTVAALP